MVATALALATSALVAPAARAAEVASDPTFTTAPSFGVDIPVTVSFHGNGTSTAGATTSYTFDFGDQSAPVVSSTPDVQHTYTAAGSYTVRYTFKRGSSTGPTLTKVLNFKATPPRELGSFCSGGPPYTQQVTCANGSYVRDASTEIFRVTGAGSGTTPVQFAKYMNNGANGNGLAAYVVDDDRGTVDGIAPGAKGYLAAATARATKIIAATKSTTSTSNSSNDQVTATVRLPVNARVAFLLLPDPKAYEPVTLSSIAAANPSLTSPVLAYVHTSPSPTNVEKGYLKLGFEDLPDGGDTDYDDGVYLAASTNTPTGRKPSLVPYAANSTPVASPVTTVTAFQTGVPVTLTATDVDEDPLTYETTAPQHGTLTGTGPTLSYTPDAGYSGSDSFTYTASDGRNTSAPATVSVTVRRQAPTATSTSADLGPGKVDSAYSVQLAAGGGAATWSLADGSLPAGLTLTDDGLLSGTPTEAGTSSFALAITNDGGSDVLRVPAFEILPKDIAPRIVTAPADLDVAKVDKPYSVQLVADGTAPRWSLAGGALPDGLTLTRAGLLAGTPTTDGVATFTLKAENDTAADTREITITVAPKDLPPGLESATLDAAVVGKPYRSTLIATGRPKPTWSVTAGTLPAGLTLGPDGVVSGTPTTEGTSTFTATASNAAGQVSADLTLVVRALPSIATTSLPAGADGAAYTVPLAASGTGPISWALTAGTLPAGLRLDPASGVISGTPTAPSDTTLTVTATNAAGSASRDLRLEIKAVAPTITTLTLPEAPVGSEYAATLAASGTTPVTWSLASGTLPQGLALSSSGVISGTPEVSGSFPVTVRASNVAGSAVQKLTLAAAVPRVPAILASPKPLSPVIALPYSARIPAAGQGTISYTVAAGTLPAGLVLNKTTGAISGVPVRTETATFTIAATNANGTGRRAFTLSTVRAGACNGGTCVDLVRGAPYTGRLPDSTDAVSFTITGGALPAGLTMDPTTGLIDGTPTTTGTSVLAVKVATKKVSVTTRLTIVVHAPPTLSALQTPVGTVGTAYLGGISASGDPNLVHTVTAGSIPPGLTLDRSSGRLTGSPRAAGTFNATITVANDWGASSTPVVITVKR